MEHLTCFVPGMLALASQPGLLDQGGSGYLAVGKQLARTCTALYLQTNTGLAPEGISFSKGTLVLALPIICGSASTG